MSRETPQALGLQYLSCSVRNILHRDEGFFPYRLCWLKVGRGQGQLLLRVVSNKGQRSLIYWRSLTSHKTVRNSSGEAKHCLNIAFRTVFSDHTRRFQYFPHQGARSRTMTSVRLKCVFSNSTACGLHDGCRQLGNGLRTLEIRATCPQTLAASVPAAFHSPLAYCYHGGRELQA
ncbi:hypothetical protein T05_1516 [Trichinella murrelli]|uniref:Uncharacterized protein n=1 Tax=Trichinella murrelli TaxID=144512 RepID=A0A0V0TW38_9BILA|nr:hypothetical protein T05_1516 [Trichinella murrelli]